MVAKVQREGRPWLVSRQKYWQTRLFRARQARSARPDSDQSAGNDSFAALVDSNAAASNNDNRAQDISARPAPLGRFASSIRQPRARQRRASDKAASDKAARNDSNDRDAAAKARDDAKADAKVDARADTARKAETTRVAKSKSDAPKSGKSDETKQASGDDVAANDQTEAAQDGTAVVTADAVAVANPAAAAPAAAASTDARSRQGDSAACDRRRGNRRLRFAGQRDRSGCPRT